MVCLACRSLCGCLRRPAVCPTCLRRLQPSPDRWLAPGLVVRSAWLHEGPARHLVHRLKYEGVAAAAEVLAAAMAPAVPAGAFLVPVPRTLVRRQRYGVDPALALASALGRMLAAPVHRSLRPAVVGRARAGRGREERAVPGFVVTDPPPSGAVLVDDVVTTGGTLARAAELTGAALAITATSRILGSSPAPIRPKHHSD